MLVGDYANVRFSVVDGWMDGWMGGWVDGWMGAWVRGWISEWVVGGGWWMSEWVYYYMMSGLITGDT